MEPNHHFLDAVLASSQNSPSVTKVFDCLNRATNRRLLIACSGGADSVFLLHVLLAYAAAKPTHLVLAHYNHAWRSVADKDCQFVSALAEKWKLPFVTEKNKLAGSRQFSETLARELRIDFLRRVARAHQCTWIAFGHQKNDILESQLLRLSRGVGIDGMAAPRAVHEYQAHPDHLRPLLGLKAVMIRSMLKTAGIRWREDSSNKDNSIQRNALRNRVLPEMIAVMDRDLLAGAANSRERFQEDAEALESWAAQIYKRVKMTQCSINLLPLRLVPIAIMRRCLYLWLSEHLEVKKLRRVTVETIIEAILRQKKTFTRSLGHYFLSIEGDCLRLLKTVTHTEKQDLNYESMLTVGGTVNLAQGAKISSELVDLAPSDLKRVLSGQVNCTSEAFVQITNTDTLLVRNWLPGDRYSPLGFSGSKKLKACFRERRICKRERSSLPIVTHNNSSIVWVPYLPPANMYKLDHMSKTALRLTYQASKTT